MKAEMVILKLHKQSIGCITYWLFKILQIYVHRCTSWNLQGGSIQLAIYMQMYTNAILISGSANYYYTLTWFQKNFIEVTGT